MEAIEYLRGEENQELNSVIILIIKEFLNISEKEAEEKVKETIISRRAYYEFRKLVKQQGGDLRKFYDEYNVQNNKEKGIFLTLDFDRNYKKDRCIRSCKSSI